VVLLCCLNVAVDAHRVPAIKVRYPDVVALIGLPVGAAGNGRSMENPYATISETHVGLVIVVGDRADSVDEVTPLEPVSGENQVLAGSFRSSSELPLVGVACAMVGNRRRSTQRR
jgi:hypothetical protein